MLSDKVWLANLQVLCPTDEPELNKLAGQMRNLFYAESLQWCRGNLGRVFPMGTYTRFCKEYNQLQKEFFKECGKRPRDRYDAVLTIIPMPPLIPELEKEACELVSASLSARLDKRLRMLLVALTERSRLYASLFEELDRVVKMGLCVKEEIDLELFRRIFKAQDHILCHTIEDARRSTGVREEIITVCEGLL